MEYWPWWTTASYQRGVAQKVFVQDGRGEEAMLHAHLKILEMYRSWREGRLQQITFSAEQMTCCSLPLSWQWQQHTWLWWRSRTAPEWLWHVEFLQLLQDIHFLFYFFMRKLMFSSHFRSWKMMVPRKWKDFAMSTGWLHRMIRLGPSWSCWPVWTWGTAAVYREKSRGECTPLKGAGADGLSVRDMPAQRFPVRQEVSDLEPAAGNRNVQLVELVPQQSQDDGVESGVKLHKE